MTRKYFRKAGEILACLAKIGHGEIIDFRGSHFIYKFEMDDGFLKELMRVHCKVVDFAGAVFHKPFEIHGDFGYGLVFDRAKFEKAADFKGLKHSSDGPLSFKGAHFGDAVDFSNAQFGSGLVCTGAKFASSDIHFGNSVFFQDGIFKNSRIGLKDRECVVDFKDVECKGDSGNRFTGEASIDFSGAVIHANFQFKKIYFENKTNFRIFAIIN